MQEMTEEIKSFRCNWCDKLYSSHLEASECAFKHARVDYANALLRNGFYLENINQACGFNWELSDRRKRITKYSCFIIPHWQGCNKPAYQIAAINSGGYLWLAGKGGPSGYLYKEMVSIDRLPNPYPREELFIYSEEKRCVTGDR